MTVAIALPVPKFEKEKVWEKTQRKEKDIK